MRTFIGARVRVEARPPERPQNGAHVLHHNVFLKMNYLWIYSNNAIFLLIIIIVFVYISIISNAYEVNSNYLLLFPLNKRSMPLTTFRNYNFTTEANGSFANCVIFSLSLLPGLQSRVILFTYVIYDVLDARKVNSIFYISAWYKNNYPAIFGIYHLPTRTSYLTGQTSYPTDSFSTTSSLRHRVLEQQKLLLDWQPWSFVNEAFSFKQLQEI